MSLRYELKLVAPTYYLPQLRSVLRLHPDGFYEQHQPRQVNSLYFDSPRLGAYQANILGERRRHKLRLRWYGEQSDNVTAQLELKRKRNMLGDKKLFFMPQPVKLTQSWQQLRRALRAATPLPWHMVLDEASEAVSITRYWRDYFVSADNQIRVTFDYKQQFFEQIGYFRPNLRHAAPRRDTLVIELKCDADTGDRLEELANQLPLRRSRNSKYVNSVNGAAAV